MKRGLRMHVLFEAIKNIRNNPIKDEFVERGVWRIIGKAIDEYFKNTNY